MARNEQRGFVRLRHPWERVFFHDLLCPSQDYFGHALMGSNRPAVVQRLRAARLDARKIHLAISTKAQLTRNHLLREITFADKQGHDKYPTAEDSSQDSRDARLQFPEAFLNLSKDGAAPQLVGMLIGWGAGIRI